MGNNTSTSNFDADEKRILRINIIAVNDLLSMTGTYGPIQINSSLNEIIRCFPTQDENFFKNKWITSPFADNPHKYNITNFAYNFAQSLNEVLNNKSKIKMHSEPKVYELGNNLFDAAGFNMPVGNNLRIINEQFVHYIDNKKYTGVPDRLVINTKKQIMCIVREDKHINNSTYLKGDIQLISNIIGAYLYNKKFGITNPSRSRLIIGIKFVSDVVEFFSVQVSDNYLEYLSNGRFPLPDDVIVRKYSVGSLCDPGKRKHILQCFESIRYHVMYK